MTSNSAGAQRLLSRKSMIMLINTAINNNSYHFARQSSQKWLETFHNDLYMESLLAKAYLGEGQINSAIKYSERNIKEKIQNLLKPMNYWLLQLKT